MSPGNVAVITGGASGIGLAAATHFAGLGMKVCIADIGADRLAEAAAQLASVARSAGAPFPAGALPPLLEPLTGTYSRPLLCQSMSYARRTPKA